MIVLSTTREKTTKNWYQQIHVLVVGGSDIENARDKYRTRPYFAVLIVPSTVVTRAEFNNTTNQSVKVLRWLF